VLDSGRDYYSAGLGGSGGGGPGSFGSKPGVKGVKGATSKPGLVDFLNREGDGERVDGCMDGSISSAGTTPAVTKRDTRKSSSCVSCMYSTGGRGFNGGGTGGVVGVEADEEGELSPFV